MTRQNKKPARPKKTRAKTPPKPVFERLKMSHEDEVLLWIPDSYRDYSKIYNAFPNTTGTDDKAYAISCQVSYTNIPSGWVPHGRASAFIAVRGYCGTTASVSVFGPRTAWHDLREGDEITISGKLEYHNGRLQFVDPILLTDEHKGTIEPFYKGVAGKIKAADLEQAINKSLQKEGSVQNAAAIMLEKSGVDRGQFRAAANGLDPEDLLMQLHRPKTEEEGLRARRIARKVCLLLVTNVVQKNRQHEESEESRIIISNDILREVANMLPFEMTACQKKAAREIVNDLASPFAMNRLLSGDVGTGKTATYLIPAVAAVRAGYSVAVMTPNQLLAQQVIDEAQKTFPMVDSLLIRGGVAASKNKPRKGTLMVGTTALLTAVKKEGLRLDFVVIDEQQKFSVDQKQELVSQHTNILEATATAIPRTLAVVSFGGMDLSVLHECPVKKSIKSMVCSESNRSEVLDFIKRVCDSGWQAAVIYAAVDAGARSKKINIVDNMEKWAQHFGDECAVIHGKLDKEVQKEVMQKAREREIKVLVASSILEIGVNLPWLRVIVVINAESFGVAQLHQIRGRVARMGGKGWFFMYQTNPEHEKSTERLQLMERFSSGFDLAEADAKQRGIGNPSVVSDEQHGSTRIIFPNVTLEFEDIEKAIDLQKQQQLENENMAAYMQHHHAEATH